jgi:phospholipid transport system transporter-binding protein
VTAAVLSGRGTGHYAINGELTFATVPELWDSSFGSLDGGSIQLDLAGITRVDSAGIALLIEVLRAVRRRGGEVSLVNAPPQLMAIATVSGLDGVLPFAVEDKSTEN